MYPIATYRLPASSKFRARLVRAALNPDARTIAEITAANHPRAAAAEAAETVATPVLDPNGGTFQGRVTVTMSCSTPNAKIWFTRDGTDPAAEGNPGCECYSGPFDQNTSATIRSKAYATGLQPSEEANAEFVIENSDADESAQALSPAEAGARRLEDAGHHAAAAEVRRNAQVSAFMARRMSAGAAHDRSAVAYQFTGIPPRAA